MGVRHEVGPALREPRRVARTSRRGRRPAGWHRRGSPEPLPFRHRKRLGDVIEAARQASPEIGGGCPAGSRSSGRSGHLPQALPQGIVDGRLEAASVRLLHPPEQGGHVRVEGQGRSHASERRWPDDLMSTGSSARRLRAVRINGTLYARHQAGPREGSGGPGSPDSPRPLWKAPTLRRPTAARRIYASFSSIKQTPGPEYRRHSTIPGPSFSVRSGRPPNGRDAAPATRARAASTPAPPAGSGC